MIIIFLRLLGSHKNIIEYHDDPGKLPKVSRNFGIMKEIDLVLIHPHDRLGSRKNYLYYVI